MAVSQFASHSQMGPTVLATIFAIGAYLKHVAEAKRTLRNEILNDLHTILWPKEAGYTQIKLKALDRTWQILNDIVAPALIVLAVLVSSRLYAETAIDLPISGPQYQTFITELLPWCDSLVFAVFTIAFVGLGYMHFYSRRTEKLISERRAEAEATIARLQAGSDHSLATTIPVNTPGRSAP